MSRETLRWLQENPWGTTAFLGRVLGSREVRAVLGDREAVETLGVRGLTRGRPAHFHALRPAYSQSQEWPCPSPDFAARMALMSIGRLRRARPRILDMLPPRYRIAWMASPVVVGRDLYPFDGLVVLEGRGGFLPTVWLLPPDGADLAFFNHAAAQWRALKEALQHPLLLFMEIRQPLSPALQRYFLTLFGGQGVMFLGQPQMIAASRWGVTIQGEDEIVRLRGLLGYKPAPRRCARKPLAQLAIEAWGKAQERKIRGLQLLYPFIAPDGGLTPKLLQALMLVARYPGLPADVLGRLVRWDLKSVQKAARRLAELGLLPASGDLTATDMARELLAALQGVPGGVLRRYRYLGSVGAIKGKEAHTETVYRFFQHLSDHGALLAFAVEPPPFRFVRGDRVFKVSPDGIGVLFSRRWGTPRFREFWLEVDRGTLSHQRLERKVDRLFAAGRARFTDAPFRVQAMAFLVDMATAEGAEARVQKIRRLLEAAHDRYRFPLTVAVGRWDWVRTSDAAWRVFRSGRWQSGRVGLVEALLAPRGEQHEKELLQGALIHG